MSKSNKANKSVKSANSVKSDKTVSVEDTYVHVNDIEHILLRPDMYVGTIDTNNIEMWVLNNSDEKFIKSEITFSAALYKIFDEILVNARDHSVRNPKTCKIIKVTLDEVSGRITVYNDGPGIPVKFHKDFGTYIPEMIFGHLRTSSNYTESGKLVGGKNGFGAKLANVLSTEFIIETIDSDEKLLYKQVFEKNMSKINPPTITPTKEKSFTKISFIPEYERFGFKKMTQDIITLFSKRVYDIAACTNKNVKVFLNEHEIKLNNFSDYIKLYYQDPPKSLIYEEISDRWKIGAIFNPDAGFSSVSFVNGIQTYNGGTHVKYICDQLTTKLTEIILKKNKKVKIKPDLIKSNITLFVECSIEDPTFNSQVKDKLNTPKPAFGSECNIPDEFVNKFAKSGIIDEVISIAEFKENKELKKSDGKKTKTLKDIIKLDDAEDAGGPNSVNCRLILTEGDSAKGFALNGLEIIGSKLYGVFPLRGKFLNVRNAPISTIAKNEEFIMFKRIMGLQQGKKYSSCKELRYGGILILTDQDDDGSHIKGLLINMIQFMWPELILQDNFIQCLKTPLIKTFKLSDKNNSEPKIFYTASEYKTWAESLGDDIKKWSKPKYYKGLGTSTAYEAKETFLDFDRKQINFICADLADDADINSEAEAEAEAEAEVDNETDSDSKSSITETNSVNKNRLRRVNNIITLAFDKKRADDRKRWLSKYDPNDILEAVGDISYADFINKELIHFSNANNIRAIPSNIDGFKPGQRKIFFAATKRGRNAKEIKVAQFAGIVATETEYHHGEVSLMETIIGMAQNFPGSNNLNLLLPNGNFGSRRQKGSDAASSRYIFTNLNKISNKIFREEDEMILSYKIEEGKEIEPVNYEPIIPMVLVNGISGIGTGFSTDIPPYNPLDLVKCLKKLIKGEMCSDIAPYYRGYTGVVSKLDEQHFVMKGVYKIIDSDTIHITEIPTEFGLEAYKAFLTSLEIIEKKDTQTDTSKQKLIDFIMKPYTNKVDIMVTFRPTELQKIIKEDKIESYLKLNSKISLTNMHAYNYKNKMTKYDSPYEILEEFYTYRLQIYVKRKAFYIRVLENDLNLIKYKVMFIENILDKKIIIERQRKEAIIEKLVSLKYPKLSSDINSDDKSYSYLINLPLWSLTFEKIEELKSELEMKELLLAEYLSKTVEQIWLGELDEFEKAYTKWLVELDEDQKREDKLTLKTKAKSSAKAKTNTKTNIKAKK
jgi:DNA topoisomerase-2